MSHPWRNWQPLLEGQLAKRCRREVKSIRREVERHPLPEISVAFNSSLIYGRTGAALLDIEQEAADRARNRLKQLLARWLYHLETIQLPSGQIGLFDGICGPAWALDQASRSTGTVLAEDELQLLDRVEELLVRHFELSPTEKALPWDLMSGHAGIFVYLVARSASSLRAREILVSLVRELSRRAVPAGPGLAWLSPGSEHGRIPATESAEGYFDLGVAHGICGVAWALANAVVLEIETATARQLLDGCIRFLLAQEGTAAGDSAFPDAVPLNPGKPRECRLAWCYGDAGIACTLLAIAELLNAADWRQRAVETALRAAERTPDSSRVVDAALCHGAAGLGHLFHRLYRYSGREALGEAARRYFELTLDLRQQYPKTGGNTLLQGPLPTGFLCGSAGVGLAMLAALSDVPPAWDVCLAVSFDTVPSDRAGRSNVR